MLRQGERKVWHRSLEDHQEEVVEDHREEDQRDKADHQEEDQIKVVHHKVKEDLHQVKVAHLQDIHSTEAHHQAKVVHQVADLKAHQWAVHLNKVPETYSETHLIL